MYVYVYEVALDTCTIYGGFFCWPASVVVAYDRRAVEQASERAQTKRGDDEAI